MTLLLAGGILCLTGCNMEDFDGGEKVQTSFHYKYDLQPGGTLTLDNGNGSVEITGWDQNSVEISGSKYARTEQLRDAIQIHVDHTDSSVAVRTILPEGNGGNKGAKYQIRVPRMTKLDHITNTNGKIQIDDIQGDANLRTSNGAIRIDRIAGNLQAHTSNGKIELEHVTGNGKSPLELTTSNGAIEATFDHSLESDLHARTTNGSITLRLAPTTSARVSANTSNGSISSDFEMNQQSREDRHHLDAQLNGGGSGSPLLDLSTSNGSIRLMKN